MAWFDDLPADIMVDTEAGKVPLKDTQFVKQSPDIGHFVNNAYAQHREVGARVPVRIETERTPDGRFVPKADSVAKWRQEHLPKLYDAGILDRPPASPDDYKFTRPEALAEGLTWNDESVKEFSAIAHKHGLSKAAAEEFLNLHGKV